MTILVVDPHPLIASCVREHRQLIHFQYIYQSYILSENTEYTLLKTK